MGLIAVLTWVGLVLQFWISFYQSLTVGRSPLQSVLFYFGFFTILTNLLIALSLTLGLLVPRSRLRAFFTKPSVETGAAIYIAVVGIVYSLVLRELWNPVGVQKIADLLLHDAVPLLYIAFWATSVPKESLRYQDACWWLAYPLAYLLSGLSREAPRPAFILIPSSTSALSVRLGSHSMDCSSSAYFSRLGLSRLCSQNGKRDTPHVRHGETL